MLCSKCSILLHLVLITLLVYVGRYYIGTHLLTFKPYLSTQMSLCTKPSTRLLECFVWKTPCFKTKPLRSLVQSFEEGSREQKDKALMSYFSKVFKDNVFLEGHKIKKNNLPQFFQKISYGVRSNLEIYKTPYFACINKSCG